MDVYSNCHYTKLSHLSDLDNGALAEMLLKGQQEFLVGFLDAQGLATAHLGPPLPGHH